MGMSLEDYHKATPLYAFDLTVNSEAFQTILGNASRVSLKRNHFPFSHKTFL